MILIFIFILPLLIYIDVYQVKVLYLLQVLLLVYVQLFMDFSLTYKSHFINRMTEHIITTGAAVTWII